MDLGMPSLQWPPAPLKIQRGAQGKHEVMCLARRKWVALEPEEWVRQHVIHHCVDVLKFPAGCVAVERPLILNGMKRRADIVCHTTDGTAQLLVECKAPDVKLSQDAVSQIARYNMVLKVPALLVTNGLEHVAYEVGLDGSATPLKGLPSCPAG